MPDRLLDSSDLARPLAALRAAEDAFARSQAATPEGRQPVHTVYVAAQHFRHDAAAEHGGRALEALAAYAGAPSYFAAVLGIDAGIAEAVHARMTAKLRREPVEDLRVDFEDGFGTRPDAEEDGAAVAVAEEMARGMERGALPRGVGVRVRSLAGETRERCLRTLGLFLARLLDATGGRLPGGFVVTLPKVTVPEEVALFAAALARLEELRGLAAGTLRFETMVEVPAAVIGPDGRCPLPRWVEAAQGRMTGVHLGVYDYTASLGIAAPHRGLRHPACGFARHVMQVALAGTGVWLSDGSTAALPVPVHGSGAASERERDADRAAVLGAWRRHFDDVTHSLEHGFYQGWDLHPAQLVTRYAAVFAFFLRAWDTTVAELRRIRERGSDDPHAADALLSFVRRGVDCGAFDAEEAAAAGGLSGR